MPGQPNRRRGKPAEPLINPETGRPAGVGMKGIDADWDPTDDAVVLADRLRRKSMQVEKKKRELAELRIAMKLRTEEAYNEGLLAAAPALQRIDVKITEIVEEIISGEIDDDRLKVLKALLPELKEQRNRLYGKTRQRVQSSHVDASVDLNRLMDQARGVPSIVEAEVLGVEVDGE